MKISLTTPTGALVETDADEVTAPGSLGEFGVLPGHVPFLSALQPGVLSYRTGDKTQVFAVGEGVLEVARAQDGGDKVIVLVDRAVAGEDVDRAAATKEVTETDAAIASWQKDAAGEYQSLVLRRAFAQARLDAAARSGSAVAH